MSYSFTDGLVATAAQLNQAIGPTTLGGLVKITPVANTPTTIAVRFPAPFAVTPYVVITPVTLVPGSSVRGCSVTACTRSGFQAVINRINTNATSLMWQAWLPSTPFATSQPAFADLLNQGSGGMVAKVGSVSITPSAANTATSATVTFPTSGFAATPTVQTTAVLASPAGVILGTSATEVSTTGCKIWVCRSNTTATVVNYIALGRV